MEVLCNEQGEFVANVTGYFLFDEFDIRREEIPSSPVSWYKHLLMGCGLKPTTMVVSRKTYEKIGFYDPSLPRYTDWDWLLRFTKLYRLSVIPEPLAVIYHTSQPQAKVVEASALRFLDKHIQELSQFGYYGKRAIGKRYLEIANYYFLEGKKSAGWKWLRQAIRQSVFQRPGMYLRILDIMLGTSIVPSIICFKSRRFKKHD
jgi:hypothetical protein